MPMLPCPVSESVTGVVFLLPVADQHLRLEQCVELPIDSTRSVLNICVCHDLGTDIKIATVENISSTHRRTRFLFSFDIAVSSVSSGILPREAGRQLRMESEPNSL
jgi:hypothetical protein